MIFYLVCDKEVILANIVTLKVGPWGETSFS